MVPVVTTIKDNVDLITLGERKIYLIGTAHVSQTSAKLVEETIQEVKPDCIAIELCEARYKSLKDPERWKNTDIVSVLYQGKGYVLLAQLMLASFQKKLGDKLNIKPGAEMMAAAALADKTGVKISLVDRNVSTTLKRTWSALGLWAVIKVLWTMLISSFSAESFDVKEIERLKSADALEGLMRDFSKEFPEVRKTLIDERDQYLASKIENSPGNTIVAVVGAGHVAGIKNWLGKQVDIAKLEIIPKRSLLRRVINWTIPILICSLITYAFFASGVNASTDMAINWAIITGSFAALGSLLCLAHPLTILSAFVAAPITTLHIIPMLASGWVAGIVEAILKKPRVADLETITDDISSFSGLWNNRVIRILIIMASTNLLGSIGKIVGLMVVARMA